MKQKNKQISLWETLPEKKLTQLEVQAQWLFSWGEQRSFPALEFMIGDGRLGDFRGGYIPPGRESWEHIPESAKTPWNYSGNTFELWLEKAIQAAEQG